MFLETEGYTISALREPEETVMTIDYAERYDDERLAQGDDNLVFAMRDDLCAAINELRSTIAAQQDTVDESFALLSEAQTVAKNRLEALRQRNTLIAVHQAREQARMDTIIELRTQLAAALATIERAL